MGAVIDVGPAQPIVKMVKRFVCPFCDRGHGKRASAVNHIARCFKNPAAMGCKTCVFWERGEAADVLRDGGGYPGQPEMCGAGVDLSDGLLSLCSLWSDQP